jgi:hypothetical protein
MNFLGVLILLILGWLTCGCGAAVVARVLDLSNNMEEDINFMIGLGPISLLIVVLQALFQLLFLHPQWSVRKWILNIKPWRF